MSKQKMTPSAAVAICLLIAFAVYVMTLKQIAKDELDANHKFTVGYVTKHSFLNKAGQAIDYTFHFNNEKHDREQLGGGLSHTLRKRYVVKFNPKDPQNSRLLLDKEVKSNITPPVEGWTKIPEGILKK